MLATKSFKSLCELIQFPGMANIISTTGSDSLENSKLDALNEILIDLDQINNYHMPKIWIHVLDLPVTKKNLKSLLFS